MSETRTVRLGDIAEINPKGDKLSSDTNVSFVGMADLNASRAEGREDSLRLFSEVSKGYTQFRRGDILVAKITPCWENGKIGIANISQSHGAGSTEFHVVRPHENIDTRYLLHKLRDPYVSALGAIRMTGSAGQRRVPASFISGLNIELPSLEEQKKYALIKDLQMEIAEKRERQQELFEELSVSHYERYFGQRENFDWVKLGDITSKIGSGATPKGGSQSYKSEGVALIRSMNVHDRRFVYDGLAFIDDKQAAALSNVEVQENDILLNITGASVARVCRVPAEVLPARVNQHVAIIRLKPGTIEPELLERYLTLPSVKKQLLKIAASGGATREAITKASLKKFLAPIQI